MPSHNPNTPDGIAPDLTDDRFLGGKLRILQPRLGYRAGLDAVLLAASVTMPAERAVRVLDAGAGVGVVGLAIAARCLHADITLVEREPELVELARQNIERNQLAARARAVLADVGRGGAALHDANCPEGLTPGAFDVLVMNPPYYGEGSGTAPDTALKRVSHQMPADTLDRWIAFAATAAATDSTLTLIHRADALAELLSALTSRFGRIRLTPVHPRERQPALRVIISAVKGSRAPLEIRPALILHEPDGRYRSEIETVLRDGAALTP